MRAFQRLMTIPVAVALVAMGISAQAAIFSPDEDVSTSAFFFGNNRVRGYVGEANRPTLRVGTDDAFGIGPDTIYLDFSSIDLSAFDSTPITATLRMTTVTGGQGADGEVGNAFTVSAHGVNADPIASITDDTNLAGPISWIDFHNNNILAADPAALSSVDCVDCEVTFDVTSIVSDWINTATTNPQFIALTGKNDTSGNDFLHGFRNNSDTALNEGFTTLTITQVPEPGSLVLLAIAVVVAGAGRRQARS